MWRMWLPSFTWLLITWSIPMEAVVGRRPFAQVLRNSLSGHPPPTGCDTLTQVHTPYFPPDLFLTQDFKSGFQKIKSGKPMPDFIFHSRYITHSKTTPYTHSGCYSQRKVKNSESKSQLICSRLLTMIGCYSQRKVKNSESKSQLLLHSFIMVLRLLFTA